MEEGEKKSGLILRVLASVVLGLLPSFLLFSIFHQSGFSLSRYANFLSDVSFSWVSWVSIIVISLVVYYLLSVIQSKKKKIAVLVVAIILSVGFVFIYLYANFLLGNDILVKLSSDKEDIFFNDGSVQTVTFTMSALMNPFCIAQCNSTFFDISSGKIIESNDFTMASLLPITKEYSFNREGKLYGQDLNRFEVSCVNQKTALCYTRGEQSKRTILLTLNYDFTPEQKVANNLSKQNIISEEKKLYNFSQKLNEASVNLANLNSFVITEDLSLVFSNLSRTLTSINNSLESIKKEWKAQNYSSFEKNFPVLKNKTSDFATRENAFLSALSSNLALYNNLSINLSSSRTAMQNFQLSNMSDMSCTSLNALLLMLNETIFEFNRPSNLSFKAESVNNLSSELHRIIALPQEGITCILKSNISTEQISRINIISINYTIPDFALEDPDPICCFYSECQKCCGQECSNENYPIIFLHGHSFNKDLSADYSLDSFAKIKSNLTGSGYIDAGAVIISPVQEQRGLWGRVNASVEVTGSYFFDISKNETGGETTVPSKNEGVDTYSIRLNDIIGIVKMRTGKDKVILVAHSMGGLVARRYIQVFGEDNIDRLILITSPNHGIETNIENYCSLIGSAKECEDMARNSIILSRLDGASNVSFPIYNIIGTGCDMKGVQGDGIVTETSQYLEFASNYYVNGTCNEINLDFLHETILNPAKHPETLELIKDSLK